MSNADKPITVLMAVHNGERFVREAIDSVLGQTFTEFEFIVVDDASTDATPALLDAYDDPRIVRVRNERNLGLPASVNAGLQRARGRYVARIDADDICEPARLARQFAYLEAHAGIAVVGTWTTEIDENGKVIGAYEVFGNPDYVAWAFSFKNVLYHPSAMFRRDTVLAVGGYDPNVRYAQDHDLWTRLVMAGGRAAVLRERLLRYRRAPGQITDVKAAEQHEFGLGVRLRYLEWLLGRPVSRLETEGMMQLMGWGPVEAVEDPRAAVRLVREVWRRCRRGAEKASRRRIDLETRTALLRRARNCAHEGRAPDVAALLTWSAARTGWGSLKDRRVWRQLPAVWRARSRAEGTEA